MNQISIKLDKNIDMDFLNFGVLKEREIFYINLKLSDSPNMNNLFLKQFYLI